MNDQMFKVAIILGSTRPGCNGEAVSKWVQDIAKKRSDANFELVDIKNLTFLYWMSRSHLRWADIPKSTPRPGFRRLIPLMHTSFDSRI